MKIRSFVFIFTLIFFAISEGLAQKIITYGILVNPGINWLSIKSSIESDKANIKGSYHLNFGFAGSYFLNKKMVFQTSILLNNYSFQYSKTQYNTNFETLDSENEPYQRQISGENLSENSNVVSLEIPIGFSLNFPINKQISLLASLGPQIIFPVNSSSKVDGVFTYKGYYADGNFTLENLPVYGFNSDVPVNKKQKLNTRFASVNAYVSLGCVFKMSRFWRFSINAVYNQPLTSMVKSIDNYHVSDNIGEYHSLLESKSAVLHSCLISFGIQRVLLF